MQRTSHRGIGKLDGGDLDLGCVGRQTLVPPGRRGRGRPIQRLIDGYTVSTETRQTKEDEVNDSTGWSRIVSASATPQLSGNG